jgi:multisubunit Na+/H+ antiporter MnhB subunit
MYHIAIMHATRIESVKEKVGKVMADAFYTALAAFIFGMCVAGIIKRFDGAFLGGAVCSGAFVIFGLYWTWRAVQRLLTAKYTTSDTAKRGARQLVGYCVAFAFASVSFGLEVMAALHSSDGYYTFSAFALGILSCIWFYGVHRQARRLISALV